MAGLSLTEYTLYQIFKGRGKTATTGCVGNIGKEVVNFKFVHTFSRKWSTAHKSFEDLPTEDYSFDSFGFDHSNSHGRSPPLTH